MTWIRWECSSPGHPVIGVLAAALRVRAAEAFGLYCATCCGFGDHQPDGLTTAVAAVTLEQWAGWQGKPGQWAAAFLARCVEHEEGQADQVGAVHGWWRNEAVLREQERRRRRPGQGTRKAAAQNPEGHEKAAVGPHAANAGPSRGDDDDDDDGDGKEASASSCAREAEPEPLTPIAYTQRCTVACNRGLRENPQVGGFNELVSSNQADVTAAWITAGVPVAVAAQAIYDRALVYRPSGRNRQPQSLGYFGPAVFEAAERATGRAQERGFAPRVSGEAVEEEDELIRAGRALDAREAQEKTRHHA